MLRSYASPLYVDMSKRTQIATPHDSTNVNKNPNDLFQDENGSERPPMTKVFIGKVSFYKIGKEKKREKDGKNYLRLYL